MLGTLKKNVAKLPVSKRLVEALVVVCLLLAISWLAHELFVFEKSYLEKIKSRGVLVVATRNGPTTYFEGNSGPTGLEYDLAKAFAEKLGVRLNIELADTIGELNQMLLEERVDIVASGLPISESSQQLVHYSTPYQHIQEQVIDKQNTKPRVHSFGELSKPLHTLANTNHLETLSLLQQKHPGIKWKIETDMDFEELLERVDAGDIPFALANSHEVQRIRHYYPELRVAFTLPKEKSIAWALTKQDDLSLLTETRAFFKSIRESGLLTQLQERYYGHVETFDYSGTQLFMRRVESRLPKYETMFRIAGSTYGIDWRLLAAMGHQESQWSPHAISPTGVRGLMMLTLVTASQMGVSNRLDPAQSIFGGAKYFTKILDRLPADIIEPDRTWMALAAYNVGYGHLIDAREITRMLNEDDSVWVNVKKNLPLLRKKKWYSKVKYGYARGSEPVHYVQNIRRYYDILKKQYALNTTTASQQ